MSDQHPDVPAAAERGSEHEENHPVTQREHEADRPVDGDQGEQGDEATRQDDTATPGTADPAAAPGVEHEGSDEGQHEQSAEEVEVLGEDAPDPAAFGEQPSDLQPDDPEPGTQPEPAPVELSGPPSQRLEQLGLVLPVVPAPVADYVPAVRTGNLVHTSGQLPFFDGQLTTTGVVGDEAVDVTPDEAAALARQCALNAIAAVASLVALDDVVRVVKVTGFVASAPGFGKQPVVVNGASALIGQVFGEAGRHARSAVGVAALPLGAPVEVEIVVEVR